MLNEALDALVVSSTGTYLDATYGAGGHSGAILDRLAPAGRLFAIDCDGTVAPTKRCASDSRFELHRCNYARMDEVLPEGLQVDGVLMDLGLSSMHLDNPERGFSFQQAGQLDMRMDGSQKRTLAGLLARTSEKDLADVIYKYGEERRSRQIAKKIMELRRMGKLKSTADLVGACGSKHGSTHPATRLFLALRIWVNEELSNLETGLRKAADLLCTGGRLVAITFHSLEDRIVKRFIGPRHNNEQTLRPLAKALRPSAAEIQANRRARSALLRVAFKP